MQSNYKLLPIATVVFKVLAWLGLGLGVLSCVLIFTGSDSNGTPRPMGVISLIAGVVYFFVFFVGAELITLVLAMEKKINS